MLYGVLLFTGFETAANLGEETAHPKRDIPRAVLIAVVAIAGFYVIGAYAQVAGFHFSLDEIGKNAGAPCSRWPRRPRPRWLRRRRDRSPARAGRPVDMMAVLIGCAVAASRGFFALGRGPPAAQAARPGVRPRHAAHGDMFVLAFCLVVIALTRVLDRALRAAGHAALRRDVRVGLDVRRLRPRLHLPADVRSGACAGCVTATRPGLVVLAAVVGFLVTAARSSGSVYKVTKPTIYAPYAALGIFVIGLLLTWVMPGRPPASAHFEELTESEQGPVKL